MNERLQTQSPEPAVKPDGRETLDTAKRAKIAALLSIGCGRRMAAQKAGCAPSTIVRAARRDAAFAAELAAAERDCDPALRELLRTAHLRDVAHAAAAPLAASAGDRQARRRLRRGLRADEVIGMLLTIADCARPRLQTADVLEFLRVLSACLAPIEGAARPYCPYCRGTVEVARAVKALSDNILRTQFPSARAMKYRRALARDMQQRAAALSQKGDPEPGVTGS